MKIKIIDEFDIWGGDHHIDFNAGVSVLVGPNGSGKSTTLISVREYCRKNKIEMISYDNLHDGGSTFGDYLMHCKGDMSSLATYMCSSEGQQILQAFGNTLYKIGQSVRNFFDNGNGSKLVICLDAVDSGLSIDNIRQIKDVFHLIQTDARKSGVEVYIIVAANSFEFAKDSNCIDVKTGKHIEFMNYDEYADWICEETTISEV